MEPIQAGDKFIFEYTNADYKPTAGWKCYISLRNVEQMIDLSSDEGDGDTFIFKASREDTAKWASGTYSYNIYVRNNEDRFRLKDGTVEILRDYASDEVYDPRSQAKRTLDAVNATLEGRATSDYSSMTHRGRSITKLSVTELIQLRSLLLKEINREEIQNQLARGEGIGKDIRINF